MRAPNLSRLRSFVLGFADLISRTEDEAVLLREGAVLLGELVARDDWLPDTHARLPTDGEYGQHLLYRDPTDRFSVVSFVWGPGQGTPVHDHTVWGLVGALRGAEISQGFIRSAIGLTPDGRPRRLQTGHVEAVSPTIGDIHQVRNALAHAPSISIHVYGGDIGRIRRRAFDPDGAEKPFVSGYSSQTPPNLWSATPVAARQDA